MELGTRYYDHVASVDFEAFWAQDFTLTSKKMSMTEYIRHPRFEAMTCAIRHSLWPQARVAVGADQIETLLNEVDWANTAFLGHHTQFDGLIATHHFNVEPVFWLDTMSISRAVYGVDTTHRLTDLARKLGLPGKVKHDALFSTKGRYLRDLTAEEIVYLCEYNIDDAEQTFDIFCKIKDYLPFDELRIIDATIRMYCEPLLLLDEQRLQGLHEREVDRRGKLVEDAGTTATVLGSAPKFADLLRSLGVVPPMKISKKTRLPTYAFAKTDLEFKALLDHPDEAVKLAVQARLGSKGSIVETRSRRLLSRVGLPTPVYLAYAAARTLRWGGGDLANWQNLPSTGDGANLRRAILAPEGCKIVGADASQVEARMVAWLSRFISKMQAFTDYDNKRGPDMYCISAEGAFGRPIDKERDPFERFIGKVLELSCQYGAGAVRVQNTLRQGFRGAPPVDLPLHEVKANIARWRMANKPIVDMWDTLQTAARRAWIQEIETEVGPLIFELFKGDGYMHLPNGTYMKYPNVGIHENDLYYNSRNGAVKLWGGHLLENASQALCAALLKHHILQMLDEMPWLRIALLVHDEVVSVIEDPYVEDHTKRIKAIMSTAAPWAEGLPLNAACTVGEYYDKA